MNNPPHTHSLDGAQERGPLTGLLAFKAHSRACGHHSDRKHHLHTEGLANMAQCGTRGSGGGCSLACGMRPVWATPVGPGLDLRHTLESLREPCPQAARASADSHRRHLGLWDHCCLSRRGTAGTGLLLISWPGSVLLIDTFH